MSETQYFPGVTPTEVLDLLIDEAAGSLSLLSEFELGEVAEDDAVTTDCPAEPDLVQIAFRVGFKTPEGVRAGYFSMPMEQALVLSGSLLMLPTDALKIAAGKPAPDAGDKEAIMEAGKLIGGAFDSALRKRFDDEAAAMFAGCQGVAPGAAPWVPNHAGEPIAVRRHQVSFRGFGTFELVLAIPA